MKFTIYEDPVSHQFTHLALPGRFLEGDALPAVVTDRWFETHDAAIAALSELLDRDAAESEGKADSAVQTSTTATLQVDLSRRPVVWSHH